MKHLLTSAVILFAALATHAQTDTTKVDPEKPDTIRIGGMIIINKKGPSTTPKPDDKDSNGVTIRYGGHKSNKNKRLSTSWLNFDLGFANYNDKTDYSTAAAQDYARVNPGEASYTESDLGLKTGKSINFNLWIVKQRYGITRDNKFNAKWGLMLESNNYRYETANSYGRDNRPFMFRDNIPFSKNKLAMDYLTVPLMIGFNTRPYKDNGFAISAGVSFGYLYSSRSKQVSSERGKQKNKGNFDFEPWKFQYIAEVGLGAVKLYGSYAPQSMYQRGLNINPYNFGFRFGEWW